MELKFCFYTGRVKRLRVKHELQLGIWAEIQHLL
jgi:hypothetical protein